MGLRHDQDRLADVVKQHHPIVKGERKIGKPAVVGGDVRQVLGVSHRVVRRIADRPAGEPREPLEGDGAVLFDELLEIAKRIGRCEPAAVRSARRSPDHDRQSPAPRT